MTVTMQKPRTLYETIEQVLNIALQQNFVGDSLNNDALHGVQHFLINELQELLNDKCQLSLDPLSVTWLVKELMLHITVRAGGKDLLIESNQQLRDTVEAMFAPVVKLENIVRKDLEVLVKVLQGATFQNKVEHALRR